MTAPAPPRVIFALGIDYNGSPHLVLPLAPSDADRIAQFFQCQGFTRAAEADGLAASGPNEVISAVEVWSDRLRTDSSRPVVVVFIAGHGRLHNGEHFLLAATSPGSPPYSNRTAISAHDIVQRILNVNAGKALVVLDTCHAGFAAQEIQRALDRAAAAQAGPGMDLGVLVSCLHHEKSVNGLFVHALLSALKDGSQGDIHWRDRDQYVTLLELRDELLGRLGDEQCATVAGRDGLKIIPNPRYDPDAPDRAVELGRLLQHLDPADRDHFLRKAASTDANDVGWFFTGREQMSRSLVTWLTDNREGMLVVTGAPGAGKSAFLGRFAVLADPPSQPACRALRMLDGPADTRPPVGVFDAVVHLKARRTDEVAIDIAEQLHIDLAAASGSPAGDLIAAVSRAGRRVTVLADALDETERGEEELVGVLRALASLPGCRVVVGTRRDRNGKPGATPDDPGPLIAALRPRRVIDLSADPAVHDDIAHYIDQRLDQSWPTPRKRQRAALAAADQAEGVFLYARFAMRVLESLPENVVDEPGWPSRLPRDVGDAGLDEVFAQDLARFDDPDRIRDVLATLAFARGKGIPRSQIWPALAHALSPVKRKYGDGDIALVIREAGWYLSEATEDGQAVFRLYHQAIADYLRGVMLGD